MDLPYCLTFWLVTAGEMQLQLKTLSMALFHWDIPIKHARDSGYQGPVRETSDFIVAIINSVIYTCV